MIRIDYNVTLHAKIKTIFLLRFKATLLFYSGFWSLFLPTSVNGRVSDIWRAYFSQGNGEYISKYDLLHLSFMKNG